MPRGNTLQKLKKVQFLYKKDSSVFMAMNCKSVRHQTTAVFYCSLS